MSCPLLLRQPEGVCIGLDDTQSVGVAHAALRSRMLATGFKSKLIDGLSYLPALDDNNSLALVEDVESHSVAESPLDAAIDILLPVDLGEVGLSLGEEEGIHATVKMGVSGSGIVPRDHDDRAHWPVLGQEAGRNTRCGEDKDGRGIEIQRGTNGGHGTGLDNGHGSLDQSAHLLEMADVGDRVLCHQACLAHLLDSLLGIVTLGCLARKLKDETILA